MVRSFAFNVYFYALTVLAALLGIVLVPVPGPKLLRGLLHRYARAVVWGMRWIGGMTVEVRGRVYLPKQGPALLACKHQAEIDGILTFKAARDTIREACFHTEDAWRGHLGPQRPIGTNGTRPVGQLPRRLGSGKDRSR